jgi:hypothetical protein
MPTDEFELPPGPPWHSLLGPLPPDVVPTRQPVASPEVLQGPTGWAIAGWEQLTVNLSAGAAGLRSILVVLDGEGRLLSASDAVLYRTAQDGGRNPPPADTPATILQISVGGRFEPDGSFHGTRWHSVAVQRNVEEDPEWESTPSSPSEDDVEALREVVAEVIGRGEVKKSRV